MTGSIYDETVCERGGRIAENEGATNCIAVHSTTLALLLSLSWWAHRQRWLAMEADVLALQQLHVEVPRRADLRIAMTVRAAGIGITWTDEYDGEPFQLYPSPVWERSMGGLGSTSDYKVLDGRTKGTVDRAIVCSSAFFNRHLHGKILTSDNEAAAWLRERAKVDVFASSDLSTLGGINA